jgi:hypothetical protein
MHAQLHFSIGLSFGPTSQFLGRPQPFVNSQPALLCWRLEALFNKSWLKETDGAWSHLDRAGLYIYTVQIRRNKARSCSAHHRGANNRSQYKKDKTVYRRFIAQVHKTEPRGARFQFNAWYICPYNLYLNIFFEPICSEENGYNLFIFIFHLKLCYSVYILKAQIYLTSLVMPTFTSDTRYVDL